MNTHNDVRILIAEDSRTQAEQLRFLLEQHGYRVTIAADGKLALQTAQAQKPTLIISDIVMPEMDGYELCKAIKSDEKLKDIPVILVTTLSNAQDVIRGLACGADNFIRKPYDEHYLLSRIDYLLMNLELRKNQKMQMGMEIDLGGQKHFITAERQQILDLLISTYEQAVHINTELKLRETELEHSNQVLRESESRLRVIMESVQTGIVIIDPDAHKIVDVNSIAANMIGAPKEEIVDSICHRFICPAEQGKCPITDLHQIVDHSERVLLTATGEKRPIIKSVTKIMLGGKVHLLENYIDITDRKRMEEQLKVSLAEKEALVQRLNELATHDGLTGLYNYREFHVLLTDELARARRFKRPVSLLLLDIDHFKRVNDTHGHLAGDAVLKGLGDLLSHHARTIDHVCRYGGEEITVILPETNLDAAAFTAERVRAAVAAQPFDVCADAPLRMTVSIGVASFPAHADNAQALVAAADAAMYTAKQGGRNRISRYEPAPVQAGGRGVSMDARSHGIPVPKLHKENPR